MNVIRPQKDLVEIFGYASDDTTKECRILWKMGACPFIHGECRKTNHDKSIVYGTCSVSTPLGDCMICPNRLYAEEYETLRRVANDAFADGIPFYTYEQYIERRATVSHCVVAIGMTSGKEIKVGKSMSMDWILALVNSEKLIEYVGIEVQSVDITGNYRDNWYAYKNLTEKVGVIPASEHGLNWANVYKRLIPQIIRKSLVYSRSSYVRSGLYFIVPEIVYKKFENVIGKDIPLVSYKSPEVITVHTYGLGECVSPGKIRKVELERTLRFKIKDFSERFISGVNLPRAEELDSKVKNVLGIA